SASMRPSPDTPMLSRASRTRSGVSPANGVSPERSVFNGNRVETAPEVPSGHRAPRTPVFGDRDHRLPVELLAIVVVQAKGALQAQVVEGQHVRPELVEHQEHFGGPSTDAFDVDERSDQRLVIELLPAFGIELSRSEVVRQIEEILRLALRKSAG